MKYLVIIMCLACFGCKHAPRQCHPLVPGLYNVTRNRCGVLSTTTMEKVQGGNSMADARLHFTFNEPNYRGRFKKNPCVQETIDTRTEGKPIVTRRHFSYNGHYFRMTRKTDSCMEKTEWTLISEGK